ncbi:MAG: DUF4350 domain-containing protein [Candidatus Contendobacter sp.]|nr:DUF4350 domain-containing protein [Candidatus Contendobacter sp.]MDG4559395.1 DUF4350 domain-containing protein [Candidatus Contendobacter sp.]
MTQPRLVLVGVGVLALLIVAGAGLWLSQNLVKRSEDVWTGYGEAARRNPFYAADRLLTRLGRAVHSVRRPRDLPPTLDPADTVLMTVPSHVLTAAEVQRLLAWVDRGGHFLIGVRREYEPGQSGDHLLNALATRSHTPTQCAPNQPVPVQPDPAAPPLQVDFHAGLRLNGDFWRTIPWGQGQVTLLTDLRLFANGRIEDHDHAGFLWALMQRNPAGTIWLQYRMQLPSLTQLLWEQAWMPLVGLMLTLLAALWHYSRRLGPILLPRADAQRRLVEHLDASSRFLWRHGAGPALLHAARHYTLRRLRHRQPGAAESSLDAALADSDQPLDAAALLHTLQTLQRLNRTR